MNNQKQEHQPVQYYGGAEAYPTYSSPMYYTNGATQQPQQSEVQQQAAESSSFVTAIPVKLISQGTTQLAYLYPSQPGAAVDPLVMAHLPSLQFTSEAASSSSAVGIVSQDVQVTSIERQRLVNTTEESSSAVTTESQLLPKRLSHFIVLGLISLAVSAFFFIHTPIVANSSRMMYTSCYTSYYSKSECYSYPKYWLLATFNGMGYTAASVSLIVSILLLVQGVTKSKSVFSVAATISVIFQSLVTLFFLAGLIVFATSIYNYGMDTLMGYIICFIIHLGFLVAIVVSIKKNGVKFETTTTGIPTMSRKRAIVGIVISGLSTLLSIAAVVTMAVFGVWLYAGAPVFLYLFGSIIGLAANIMLSASTKNLKAASILFRISGAMNWMVVGVTAALFVAAIYLPFVFGIIIPVMALCAASSIHSSVTVQAIHSASGL